MSKLNATLQQALAFWRADLEHAHATGQQTQVAALEAREVAVSVAHTGPLEALQAAGMRTGHEQEGVVRGYIRLRDVERLAELASVESIAMPDTVRILDGSVAEMRVPWKVPPTTPWPGKGANVIVAIIDTGIDIFHESFRKADGKTRILELWDQAATVGGTPPPAKFTRGGRVYSQANIDAAITAGPPFVSTDEIGHGTHVAGIAAGNGLQDDRCSKPGNYIGVAPEADLIIVKAIGLPSPAGAGDTEEAILWCSEARTRLPGSKPVVINCSYGSDIGPHDGAGFQDAFIRRTLRPAAGLQAGIAIVVSAGNAGAYEIHESGVLAANANSTTPFYLGDGSRRDNLLDIWYTGAATLNIELIAPPQPGQPGASTGTITPTTPGTPFTVGQMQIDINFTGPFPLNGNRKRILVTIRLAPGAPADTLMLPGTWQIKLTETAGAIAMWDAWFASKHGDTFPTFWTPGDPVHTPRRRENTIDEPGTAPDVITVASYDNEGDHQLSDSSSRGPDVTRPGLAVGEFKPTVAAPGVAIKSSRSRNDPDTNSSCCDQKAVDKDGTSMAAPHVTGLVALMFQKNKDLNFEQVRAHIQRAARIDGIPAAEVPPIYDPLMNIRANQLWGSGKVNAAQALADIPAALAPAIAGGGGGGGGGGIGFVESDLGYIEHNFGSRLGQWGRRFGQRPGMMLFASLVSEHLDEVLRLVNHNRRVGAVWRRNGGPLLVRRLLYGPPPQQCLMPAAIEGCDVAKLLLRFLPILARFGGPRLQADIAHFRAFVDAWPGADIARLDAVARQLESV